jgi:hypothetical protein
VRSTAAPYTESRLAHLVRNKCVGFPVVEQQYNSNIFYAVFMAKNGLNKYGYSAPFLSVLFDFFCLYFSLNNIPFFVLNRPSKFSPPSLQMTDVLSL